MQHKAAGVNTRLCDRGSPDSPPDVDMRFSGSVGFRIVFDRVFDHALECGDHLVVGMC